MSRLDWIIIRRLSARVGMTLFIFFGLMALVESLDTYRFKALTQIGGPLLALEAIVSGAARNLIGTLPVTLLIGTIIGVLDLQARREMTIIKASGVSIWRVLRYPLLGAVLLGLVAAFAADFPLDRQGQFRDRRTQSIHQLQQIASPPAGPRSQQE